ncbi:MAG: sigma-54-dependent Fis family transcriptional regulator [Deltaproteobacteria bacterium]|nr:sigma-54-dependent Fis family transcriptional regulator [Deltaproteobacteria bacterium]
MTMLRILIAEDEAHNREALVEIIKRLGHEPIAAVDGQDALERASTTAFDLILSDVRMPRVDGLQFFDALRKLSSSSSGGRMPPFIFMTAYGRLEEAVEAMRKGALNFLTKPLHKKDISVAIEDARRVIEARPDRGAATAAAPGGAVYVSRAFADVVALIDKVAPSQASVLLVGESGTGKEVLARRLHENSTRGAGPFVAFHAGAMPETLLESELFGHEKGAFTGADTARLGQIRSAHRGTFFLDELSSMPAGLQAKLLRVLQDKQVQPLGAAAPIDCDVRWVAASNKALEPLVEQGQFREDLLYRLRVVVVELPPLRSRPEDIGVLTDQFLRQFALAAERPTLAVDDLTRELLRNYSWPGNVRELRNVVERAVALADGNEFTTALLPERIALVSRAREIRVAVGTSLQSAEDRIIEETLRSCAGDKVQAAAILGVAPRTIYRWIEKRAAERGVAP